MSVTLQADPAWSPVAGSLNDSPSLWRHQSGVQGSVHGNESGEWLRVADSEGECVYYDLIDVLLEFNYKGDQGSLARDLMQAATGSCPDTLSRLLPAWQAVPSEEWNRPVRTLLAAGRRASGQTTTTQAGRGVSPARDADEAPPATAAPQPPSVPPK